MMVDLDPGVAQIFQSSTSVSGKSSVLSDQISLMLISFALFSGQGHQRSSLQSQCEASTVEGADRGGEADCSAAEAAGRREASPVQLDAARDATDESEAPGVATGPGHRAADVRSRRPQASDRRLLPSCG